MPRVSPCKCRDCLRSREGFFQAVLGTCSSFTGVKKKSQLDPACSVTEHQELRAALGPGSSWPPPLTNRLPQLHREEPDTYSSFQEIKEEERTTVCKPRFRRSWVGMQAAGRNHSIFLCSDRSQTATAVKRIRYLASYLQLH